MTRQEKYPDTNTFHWYNANPKNKYTGDCVIRAISVALELPWEQVYRDLVEIGIKYGYMMNDPKTYSKYLDSKGWVKQKPPRKFDGTKYTGVEFCKEFATPFQNIIAHIGGHHIVAIVNSKVYDTWDSTDGCIGNYWVQI